MIPTLLNNLAVLYTNNIQLYTYIIPNIEDPVREYHVSWMVHMYIYVYVQKQTQQKP